MAADLFEKLSGGRFLDLGSRLSPDEIAQMASKMSRDCPECMGSGIGATAGILTLEGIVVIPLPCQTCNGTGEAFYLSHN
jgi:DnaJ-class molecular chaperone